MPHIPLEGYRSTVPIEIAVSRHKCIATKACMNRAPGVFELDPTRVSSVKDPDGEDLDTILSAAEACPTGAITVYQDGVKLT
jgi:ferredoxin